MMYLIPTGLFREASSGLTHQGMICILLNINTFINTEVYRRTLSFFPLMLLAPSKCFLECLQQFISSVRLLSVASSGWHIIKYFSRIHKLHLFVVFEYAFAWPNIFHCRLNSLFELLSFHTCLLNSVEFICFSFRKECL